MSSFYKKQVNDWVAKQDVIAGLVLDIGGAQSPVRGRTKSWDVATYKIVDLETPHVELAKPDIALDMNRVDQHDAKLGQYYGKVGVVFALGVFDFSIAPLTWIITISKLLKKDGVAWIQFPGVYPHHEPVGEVGYRYTESVIRNLATVARLEVAEIVYQMATSHKLIEFYQEERMSMAEGVNHSAIGYIVKLTKKN